MARQAKDALLTQNDKEFIKAFVKTGNRTKAARKAYAKDANDNYNALAQRGFYYLQKPKIKQGIAQVLDDDFLAAAHAQLFNQVRVEYFVFPKRMDDDEIIAHVESVGIKVITIRESDKGKMAFYSLPDAQAIKGALEMAFKIKGTYAPEKRINLNLAVEASDRIKQLAKILNTSK